MRKALLRIAITVVLGMAVAGAVAVTPSGVAFAGGSANGNSGCAHCGGGGG